MRYWFDGNDIDVPREVQNAHSFAMGSSAPYSQFVLNKLGDTRRELACVKAVISHGPDDLAGVYDLMGGIGMTAAIIRARYAHSPARNNYTLNDFSPECARILAHNYPTLPVHCGDGLALLENLPTFDGMVWIDFNNLSWRTLDQYTQWLVLARSKAQWLMFTDSSIFGMSRFGARNLKHYGVGSIEEYFRVLMDGALSRIGWSIRAVSYFANASFILCGTSPAAEPFPIIPNPTPMQIVVAEGL